MKNATHRAMRQYQLAAQALTKAIREDFPAGEFVYVQLTPGVNTFCEVIEHGEVCRSGRTLSLPDHLLVRDMNNGAEHRVWIARVRHVTEEADEDAA